MVWSTTQSQSYEKSTPESVRSEPRLKREETRQTALPFLSRLLNDRDSLLITGLLLLLISERADRKLILALAFALLA